MNEHNMHNPLSEFISDEVYELLDSRGLINKKTLRDYIIRKRFNTLRSNKISSGEAVERIQKEYPYLQFDSLRKIIYIKSKTQTPI